MYVCVFTQRVYNQCLSYISSSHWYFHKYSSSLLINIWLILIVCFKHSLSLVVMTIVEGISMGKKNEEENISKMLKKKWEAKAARYFLGFDWTNNCLLVLAAFGRMYVCGIVFSPLCNTIGRLWVSCGS